MGNEIGLVEKSNLNIGVTLAPGTATQKSTLPSGIPVIYREMNGEDEDLISKMGQSNLDTLDQFLAGVIVGPEKYTQKDIAEWKTIDRYYLLLLVRILTHGPEMDFDVQLVGMDGKPTRMENFTEDLSKYLTDFSKDEIPESDFEFAAKRHPAGLSKHKDLTLASEKQVRYKYASAKSERAAIALGESGGFSRNDSFKIRDLEILKGETWTPVINFSEFSIKDMREMRKDVEESDVEFGLLTELTNQDTGIKSQHSLVEFPEFFFPS